MNYPIPYLPLPIEFETKAALKKAVKAHQALAELKGASNWTNYQYPLSCQKWTFRKPDTLPFPLHQSK
jgi:hypothetical protein